LGVAYRDKKVVGVFIAFFVRRFQSWGEISGSAAIKDLGIWSWHIRHQAFLHPY
jgi:hypothetical protein